MSGFAIWLAVALGGALGAVLRGVVYRLFVEVQAAGASEAAQAPADRRLGRATLVVNVTGSFLLGLLLTFWTDDATGESARAFWTTGFCGSLTTFSTFCADTVGLAGSHGRRTMLGFVLANALLSVLGLTAGLLLVR